MHKQYQIDFIFSNCTTSRAPCITMSDHAVKERQDEMPEKSFCGFPVTDDGWNEVNEDAAAKNREIIRMLVDVTQAELVSMMEFGGQFDSEAISHAMNKLVQDISEKMTAQFDQRHFLIRNIVGNLKEAHVTLKRATKRCSDLIDEKEATSKFMNLFNHEMEKSKDEMDKCRHEIKKWQEIVAKQDTTIKTLQTDLNRNRQRSDRLNKQIRWYEQKITQLRDQNDRLIEMSPMTHLTMPGKENGSERLWDLFEKDDAGDDHNKSSMNNLSPEPYHWRRWMPGDPSIGWKRT